MWDEGDDPSKRGLSYSELDKDSSHASDPASLDSSDKAVISRAVE